MSESTAMLMDLSEVAYGLESVAGTLVAADTGLVVDEGLGAYREIEERTLLEAPRGVLAEVDDVLTRRHSELVYTQWLTYEDLPLALLCGLEQVSATGDDPYTYTFLPGLTAPEALDSATFEVFGTDGTTQHHKRRFGHAQVSEFEVSGSFGDPAQFRATWFGRAGQALSSPASPATLAREPIPSELFTLAIDDAWEDLGETVKSTVLRSFDITVMTGVAPDYVLAGRSDLDFAQIRRGRITGDFRIVAEFNGDAATEVAAWRAGTLRFIRLAAEGPGDRTLQLDASVKYMTPPSINEADGLVTVDLVGRLRFDQTSAHVFGAEVVNKIASY